MLSLPDCSVRLRVSLFGLRPDKEQPTDWNKMPRLVLRRLGEIGEERGDGKFEVKAKDEEKCQTRGK